MRPDPNLGGRTRPSAGAAPGPSGQCRMARPTSPSTALAGARTVAGITSMFTRLASRPRRIGPHSPSMVDVSAAVGEGSVQARPISGRMVRVRSCVLPRGPRIHAAPNYARPTTDVRSGRHPSREAGCSAAPDVRPRPMAGTQGRALAQLLDAHATELRRRMPRIRFGMAEERDASTDDISDRRAAAVDQSVRPPGRKPHVCPASRPGRR